MSTMAKTQLPSTEARITDQEFEAIRQLVYSKFGINLTEQKKTLVVGRLQKVLRQRNLATFKDYHQWLVNDRSGEALDELANRISTNHTFFNRENAHFDFFTETVLPELAARHRSLGNQELRIWCAGCSSGEEPYMLMMLMMEFFGVDFPKWTTSLLATDISATALQTAMKGRYQIDRVAQLPAHLRSKYFRQGKGGKYQVTDDVRQQIFFRRHNLMARTFPFKQPFDAIFCRNVMIYFDRETRNTLVPKFYRHTAPGGYLFIGHSETLNRRDTRYRYVQPAVYRK